jgi:hypothetical protein
VSSYFRYDAALQRHVSTLLGAERFAPYLTDGTGDVGDALKLYVWNASLSAAFLAPLGAVEVALRKALSDALTSSFTIPWHDDPAFLGLDATGSFVSRIAAAKGYIGRGRPPRPVTTGRIVAELGLSFWVSLLRPAHNRTLWPHLRGAFVRYTHRKSIMKFLEPLPAFRNRSAHHEPIYSRRPHEIYAGLLEVAAMVSPELPPWIEHHSRVRQCLSDGPNGTSLRF